MAGTSPDHDSGEWLHILWYRGYAIVTNGWFFTAPTRP
jgi:hypothetical protein